MGRNRYRNQRILISLTLLIALLTITQSLFGLLGSDIVYPTQILYEAFVPNDLVNIVIGVPIILLSVFLAKKGNLAAILFTPGASFYFVYNYLIYLLGVPFNITFVLSLILLVLNLFLLIFFLYQIDANEVKNKMIEKISVRLGGIPLVLLGTLFFIVAIQPIVSSIVNNEILPSTELALHISDLVISPAMIIGGVMLLRKYRWGFVVSVGLLFQVCMLFIGLIIVLVIQPIITDIPFPLIDIAVVALMGIICSIPLIVYVRKLSECN